LVVGIDRYERNRSRFISDAVRHELKRRQRPELQRSLEKPHHDSIAPASLGLSFSAESLPANDADLLDSAAGVAVRWIPDQGWQEPRS
jgi:hypothetical protein